MKLWTLVILSHKKPVAFISLTLVINKKSNLEEGMKMKYVLVISVLADVILLLHLYLKKN